jgi:hypothetical protein
LVLSLFVNIVWHCLNKKNLSRRSSNEDLGVHTNVHKTITLNEKHPWFYPGFELRPHRLAIKSNIKSSTYCCLVLKSNIMTITLFLTIHRAPVYSFHECLSTLIYPYIHWLPIFRLHYSTIDFSLIRILFCFLK